MKTFVISICGYVLGFITQLAASVSDALLRASYLVAEQLTPQKLEAELAQNSMQKSTDSPKPVSSGSDSGDSPLSFVSMLKAVNGHTGCMNFA